jgi:hypothetical protein
MAKQLFTSPLLKRGTPSAMASEKIFLALVGVERLKGATIVLSPTGLDVSLNPNVAELPLAMLTDMAI